MIVGQVIADMVRQCPHLLRLMVTCREYYRYYPLIISEMSRVLINQKTDQMNLLATDTKYYFGGLLHRNAGPASVSRSHDSRRKEYYRFGEKIDPPTDGSRIRSFRKWIINQLSIRREIFVVTEMGSELTHLLGNEIHRRDGPAIVGNQFGIGTWESYYMFNRPRDSDFGPSNIYYHPSRARKREEYSRNGMYHRDNDSPAVSEWYESGRIRAEHWYEMGKLIRSQYYDDNTDYNTYFTLME